MIKGGFVEAVTNAIKHDSDNWGIDYYRGKNAEWNQKKLNVYMETRGSDLGPEFDEAIRVAIWVESTLSARERIESVIEFDENG